MTTITQPPYQFDQSDTRTRRVSAGLIRAVCNHIVENIQPNKIILFGSRGANTARKDSDMDLLVILPSIHPLAGLSNRERAIKVLNLFRYRFFALDAIVVTESEIDELAQKNEGEWNLILEILKTGQTFYARPTK